MGASSLLAAIGVGLVALLAAVPATLFVFNLRRYQTPRTGRRIEEPVAVLIPARDEEANIGACVESVLASLDVDLEVWVCDDNSTDRTAAIVQEMAARDARVFLVRAPELPAGWNGKQHACWKLARSGVHAELLLFLDADVRLHPWAIARCAQARRRLDVALLSGFPRQKFSGFLDALLLPLIHFVLLAYLPLRWMQETVKPEFAAGCGQFLLVERAAYFASGGHAAIRGSRHDGLRLPQVFREHGFRTDLVDLTRIAKVRMYGSAGETWSGLAKNATEGMAAKGRIGWFTALLGLGQVVPGVLLAVVLVGLARLMPGPLHHDYVLRAQPAGWWMLALLVVAVSAAFGPRLIAARRFKQPLWSALLHPLGVAVLLVLQWLAWWRERRGRTVGWRERQYATGTGDEVL